MKATTIILCLLLLSCGKLMAQTISASQGGGVFIQFNNQNDLDNGGTSIGNVQLQLGMTHGNSLPNFKITAQVTSPISIVNGTTLAPQYVSLRHNPSLAEVSAFGYGIQAPTNYIALSYSEVTLIQSSATPLIAPPYYSTYIKYDLKIAGGPQLVELQNGNYLCQLTFRLYDQNNILKSTSTAVYNFGKYFNGTSSGGTPITSLSLPNGATDVGLNFTNESDYVNGVSVTINDGLRVQSAAAYQIKIKSSATNFSSSQPTIIPVSAVKLLTSAGTAASSTVTYTGTISLDNVVKTILRQPIWTDANPVYYNLKYSTTPNDINFKNARAGNYTTTLTYTLEPN